MTVYPLRGLFLKSDSGVWADEDPIDGINILRSTNFTPEGDLDLNKLALRAVEGRHREAKLLLPGDILLEKSGGGPKQPVGRVALFRGDNIRPHVFGNFIARLRVNHEICVPEFLFYILRRMHEQGISARFQKQTTGIRNLEMRRYFDLEIDVPMRGEQRRIVEILDRAASIRKLRQHAHEAARQIVPALFNQLFGDPGTNPMDWPVLTLQHVLADGIQNGLYRPATDYGQGTRILRIDSFYDGEVQDVSMLRRLSLDNATIQKYLLRPNDIVLNRVNSLPYLGKSAIIPAMDEPVVFESNMMRFSINPEHALPEYVIAYLQTSFARKRLVANAKAAINQASINQQDVGGLPIPVPTIAAQTVFVDRMKVMSRVVQQQARTANAAELASRAIEARMFSA